MKMTKLQLGWEKGETNFHLAILGSCFSFSRLIVELSKHWWQPMRNPMLTWLEK
jgi:hypothetical protein